MKDTLSGRRSGHREMFRGAGEVCKTSCGVSALRIEKLWTDGDGNRRSCGEKPSIGVRGENRSNPGGTQEHRLSWSPGNRAITSEARTSSPSFDSHLKKTSDIAYFSECRVKVEGSHSRTSLSGQEAFESLLDAQTCLLGGWISMKHCGIRRKSILCFASSQLATPNRVRRLGALHDLPR